MKQSKPYPKPTTKMVIDQTLRGYYAMNAPDVPDWFVRKNENGKPTLPPTYDNERLEKFKKELFSYKKLNEEELFFEWRWYYADKMIEMETKK